MSDGSAALAPAWRAAFREHDAAVDQFLECLRLVPAEAWQRPTAPGKWSPAAVALHIVRAYEFGHEAVTRGTPMRPRLAPWQSWLLRTFALPLVLASDRFPEGAQAPLEVVPDATESASLSMDDAMARVRRAADAAAGAIADAAARHAAVDITHAYFGRLPALTAFRFVSAHTRHHARLLRRVLAA